MNAPLRGDVIKQHLIDPEICIRCNTCEETCPVDAITHDSRNYVVNADVCNACLACISPCPTGAIDNWRNVARFEAYSIEEQLTWDVLPSEGTAGAPHVAVEPPPAALAEAADASPVIASSNTVLGSARPPASAARPHVNLFTHKSPILATVVGNFRVTDVAADSDTHHIVLDFGSTPFPVLEGQSIGILTPGVDASGRAHYVRQYSIASPRDGERPGYNNLSITVKRVTVDHAGKPVRGICSNYLCDLKKGDAVKVIGPFGNTFLMPNHRGSHLIMICTGTGSAPMRAMTERRRRQRDQFGEGRLLLFFGARTKAELPYFGPLTGLPKDFIDTNLAFSRAPNQPKRYVQDLLRERADDLATLLEDTNTHIYVCGLKGMEEGVMQALNDVAAKHGGAWEPLWQQFKAEGRFHVETY
jgi:benzoyl-CoA 2,3-epoxidase subunit A